jgi:S-formylglutathione hydrolase FrmB
MRRTLLIMLATFAAAAAPAAAATNPLRLLSTTRPDPRLEQLAFQTPAVAGTTHVRVLLPAGYAAHSHRRYPVLYLLHGAVGDYTSWTVQGAAERLAASYPLIVVMPDSGPSGGYTNWYNGGAGGPPEWETYHVDQLIPWIDAHLRTDARRAERAVAGLSMGGFGAMSYAARHPDLFAAAASFSGAVDTSNPLDIAVTPNSVWGPRATEQVRWRAHNPWDLAENLRGVNLTIRTGNGMAGGPYGPGAPDIVEATVHQMSVNFHDRLVRLRIPSLWDDYGPGGHDWPYWQGDLRETLPRLMSVFVHPRPAPAAFTFTAVEPRFKVYGWSVALRRRALEFSTLRVSGRAAFRLAGSGRATVTSAALYRGGESLRVVVRDATGTHRWRTRAGRGGRLMLRLSLGPSNPYQEYTPRATTMRHRSMTARVLIQVPR